MKKFLIMSLAIVGLSGCSLLTPPMCNDTDFFNDTVYFDFDSSVLTAETVNTLNGQVEFLKENEEQIVVAGHADERGTREYNIGLGERRANAVATYLETQGIEEERISVVSYGKDKPAVEGHNEAAWAKNRRATTHFVEAE